MNYPHLAARLFNTPLMARFDTAQTFAAAFDRIVSGEVQIPRTEGRVTDSGIDQAKRAAYSVTSGGIGVLTIEGPLVQRAGQMNPDCSPITSYQWINAQVSTMAADPDVKAILLEFDSPGGEVANVFELGQRFAAVTEQTGKPVWAIANEGAFSAGYALAAGAGRILLPATAMAGSVGVIMLHVDASKAVEKKGYAVTPIFAGARKNDFSPYEPLTREALTIGQARIDELYGVFTEFVAQKRGMEAAAVRGTEAGIFNAADAVRLGLADEVATFDETLGMLADSLKSKSTSFSNTRLVGASTTKGTIMADQKNAPATEAATNEQLNAARAEGVIEGRKQADADIAKAKADGIAEGATAERTRIKSLLSADSAKTRPVLAQHIALESDMTVEQGAAILEKAAPEAVAKSGGSLLAEAMAKVTNARISASGGLPEGGAARVKVDLSKHLAVVQGGRAA